MPKCSYCGNEYDIHKGLTFVKLDGSVVYLCSAKCRKNMEMKRRKVRWISKAKKTRKEIREEIQKQSREKEARAEAMKEKEVKEEKT